jgi:hypothetical protein
MIVVGGVAKAAGAKVLTGTRPARKALPRTNRTLLVALTLVALVAFAALIAASNVPSAEHSSVGSKDSQSGAETPVSEPGAAPQMSEEEAIDAYEKLPLSVVPNEGQTDEAIGYRLLTDNESRTLAAPFAALLGFYEQTLQQEQAEAQSACTTKSALRMKG